MEFSNVGQHCAVDDCRVKDFLPFVCSQCKKSFCVDHRSPGQHGCNVEARSNEALFCPRCHQQLRVRYDRDDDPQLILAQHAMSNCTKHVVASFQPKHACQANGCKKKTDAALLCFQCKKNFCLTHRAPDSHKCEVIAKQQQQQEQQSSGCEVF